MSETIKCTIWDDTVNRNILIWPAHNTCHSTHAPAPKSNFSNQLFFLPQMFYNAFYIISFKPPQTYEVSIRLPTPCKIKCTQRYPVRNQVLKKCNGLYSGTWVSMKVDYTGMGLVSVFGWFVQAALKLELSWVLNYEIFSFDNSFFHQESWHTWKLYNS